MSVTSPYFAVIVGTIAILLLAVGVVITISDLRKRNEAERHHPKF